MTQSAILAALVAGDPAVGLYVVAACAVLALVLSSAKSVGQALMARQRDRAQSDALLRLANDVEALRREHQILSQDLEARLTRIEQIAEALHIEVERVGEGQRFVSKVLASGSASDAK